MQTQTYDGTALAIDIHEDGSGYIYYPSGNPAISITPISAYQKSFCAFDKNRKMTMLLGVDEHGVGFASSSKRKAAQLTEDTIVCLKAAGGLYSENGVVKSDWAWNANTQVCSLGEPLAVHLNEHLLFRFKNPNDMSLEFQCGAITFTCDLGIKKKRYDSYLDHVKREPGGRLVPQIDHVSLRQRQKEFNESMGAQRNKLHPKSENLTDMVRGIVEGLERRFEGIETKMLTSPGLDSSWKSEALGSTLREIPRIPIAGTESGTFAGFGKHIYSNPEDIDLSKTIPANLALPDGTWKNAVEIRSALRETNPPLKRSGILRANSGRYSDMLVVDGKQVTSDNPTGMTVSSALPLPKIHWKKFKELVDASRGAPMGPLYVALVMRPGDPVCSHSEYAAEVLNATVLSKPAAADTGSTSDSKGIGSKIQFYKIDVGEDPVIVNEIGIKHLPVFIMYHGGALAYAGPVGGKKVKLVSSHKPQVMVIEPDIRHQVAMEKTIRRIGCDTFLCLTIGEALERIHQFSSLGGRGPTIIFDLVLISDSVTAADLSMLSKKLAEQVKLKRTVISGLVDVLGEHGSHNLHAVKWEDACTEQHDVLMHPAVASCVSIAIQKPVKAASINKLLSLREVPQDHTNFGLTPDSLLAKLNEVLDGLHRNAGMTDGSSSKPYVGIRLSAQDVRMRGLRLTK